MRAIYIYIYISIYLCIYYIYIYPRRDGIGPSFPHSLLRTRGLFDSGGKPKAHSVQHHFENEAKVVVGLVAPNGQFRV